MRAVWELTAAAMLTGGGLMAIELGWMPIAVGYGICAVLRCGAAFVAAMEDQ